MITGWVDATILVIPYSLAVSSSEEAGFATYDFP